MMTLASMLPVAVMLIVETFKRIPGTRKLWDKLPSVAKPALVLLGGTAAAVVSSVATGGSIDPKDIMEGLSGGLQAMGYVAVAKGAAKSFTPAPLIVAGDTAKCGTGCGCA